MSKSIAIITLVLIFIFLLFLGKIWTTPYYFAAFTVYVLTFNHPKFLLSLQQWLESKANENKNERRN